jgi:hypothetical protein
MSISCTSKILEQVPIKYLEVILYYRQIDVKTTQQTIGWIMIWHMENIGNLTNFDLSHWRRDDTTTGDNRMWRGLKNTLHYIGLNEIIVHQR